MKFIAVLSVSLVFFSFKPKNYTTELNQFMTSWHQAASEANYDNYFNAMAESFIFLGTAPGERWTKSDFGTFFKTIF